VKNTQRDIFGIGKDLDTPRRGQRGGRRGGRATRKRDKGSREKGGQDYRTDKARVGKRSSGRLYYRKRQT